MTPSPAATPPRRRRGLRIALVVWLVASAVLLGLAAVQLVGYASRPPDQHVPASGGTVSVAVPGEYAVYYETGRAGSAGALSGVTGPDGATLPVARSSVTETYTAGNRYGVRLGSITAPVAGSYSLAGSSDGPAGDELVLSRRTVGALLGVVFTGVAGLLTLVLGGIVLLAVSLTGRRQATATPWPDGPGPWPGPNGSRPGAGGPWPGPRP